MSAKVHASKEKEISERCWLQVGVEVRFLKKTMHRLVVPLLAASQAAEARQGGVQLVFHLVNQLQEAVVPYLFLLVVPTMACMSDHNYGLRVAATSSFASMVALLPLAQVISALLRAYPANRSCSDVSYPDLAVV